VEGRKAIFGEIFRHDAVDLDVPASSLRARWMIEGSWKLILPTPLNAPDTATELYNLVDDPGETKNLADREKETVERLKAKVDAWWAAKMP